MKNNAAHFVPKRKDAVVRQLSDEFVVYDKQTNMAHCLNQTAANVWRLCDGKKSVAEIARAMDKQSRLPVDEGLVWMALRQLEKSGLLLEGIRSSSKESFLSRRELVRKLGVVAALALPAVTSIMVPTPAEAVSCATLGQSCETKPCCPGLTCQAVTHLCV
jgi:hypothetical protein